MPPVHLLIKPVSGQCNLRCRYCFYHDVLQKRGGDAAPVQREQRMRLDTLEQVVAKGMAYAQGEITFAFQGGEPTLAGLDFYRRLMELESRYNTRRLSVHNAIQTNGMVIDREWAQFFAQNHFLVGLSLDGNKEVNDAYRLDGAGKGSYSKILQSAQLLERYGVALNILTVVTSQTVRAIHRIYSFYRRNGFHYLQFIPCLDPLGEERGQREYSLTPQDYGRFLNSLFDLWYPDMVAYLTGRGPRISIRYFDNLLLMLLGNPPESCGMAGICSRQNVVEADGSVYPCDFYVLDRLCLGNLVTDSMEQIERARDTLGFITASKVAAQCCRNCRWYPLCRGGCRRDRDEGDRLGDNYFCESYQMFFSHTIQRFEQLAGLVQVRAGKKADDIPSEK